MSGTEGDLGTRPLDSTNPWERDIMNNRSVSGVTAQVWQGPLTERAQIHADRKIDQLQSPTTEIVEVARIREEAQFAANVGEVAKRHERVGHIARRLGSTALLMEGAR